MDTTFITLGPENEFLTRITGKDANEWSTVFKSMMLKQRTKMAMWKKIKFAVNRGKVILQHFKFDNKHYKFTITYLVGVSDHTLMFLTNKRDDLGFPRGFSIVWNTHDGMISMAGFLSKFTNDDRNADNLLNEITTDKEDSMVSFYFTKKFSGSLGILSAFRYRGAIFLFFSSKNSTGNYHTTVFERLFSSWYKTSTHLNNLVEHLLQGHCIAFEVCSNDSKMEHHGSLYKQSMLVTLTIARTYEDDKILTFISFDEMWDICHKYQLPHGHQYLVSKELKHDNDGVVAFFNELHELRDIVDNAEFDSLIYKYAKLGVIQQKTGNIEHHQLSNVLEGLVIWIVYDDHVNIKKYKFAVYTRMTMLFRTAVQTGIISTICVKGGSSSSSSSSSHYSVEGETNALHKLQIQCRRFLKMAEEWANIWVVNPKRRKWHVDIAMRACKILTETVYDKEIHHRNYLLFVEPAIQQADVEQDVMGELADYDQYLEHPCIIILVIGPVGCGKSSILSLLKKQYGTKIDCIEVDARHENISNGGKIKNNRVIGDVIQTVMAGRIPVIENGGGLFYSIDRKTGQGQITFDAELQRRSQLPFAVGGIIAPQYLIDGTYSLDECISITNRTVESRVERGVYQIERGTKNARHVFHNIERAKSTFRKVTRDNFKLQQGIIDSVQSRAPTRKLHSSVQFEDVPVIGFTCHTSSPEVKICDSDLDKLTALFDQGQPRVEPSNGKWTCGYTATAKVRGTEWYGHITSNFGVSWSDIQDFLGRANGVSEVLDAIIIDVKSAKKSTPDSYFLAVIGKYQFVGIDELSHMTINTPYPSFHNHGVLTKLKGRDATTTNINHISYTAQRSDERVKIQLTGTYAYPV